MPEDKTEADVNGDVGDKNQPVTFTDEQQTLLNQIIDKAYSKAYTKAEESWKPKLEALTTQVDELKKKQPAATVTTTTAALPQRDDKPSTTTTSDNKDGRSTVDIDAILARLDEVQGVANSLKADKEKAELEIAAERKKNKEARVKEQFFRSSDKIPFFDRMDVFSLIQQDLDLDDNGDVVIMNPKTKQPRISGADPERNLSLDQFLGEFAKAKPNMVRAQTSEGGSGASENRTTQVVVPEKKIDYSKLTPDEMRDLTSKVISKQYTQRS